MEKLIITAALTGGVPTKEMNSDVPISPEEIAASAEKCWKAGASIVHIHARDATGKPTLDVDVFQKIHKLITERTDLIVQISTGARAGKDMSERASAVREINPEMASLTTGSMNFPDQIYENSFETIEYLAAAMKESGTKPEIEIFEAGMISNTLALIEKGLVKFPLHFDFVMGSKGSQPATARQLVFLTDSIPAGSTWTVAGIGRWQLPMGLLAIAMGGHVRVGLEDNIFYRYKELANNEQLVSRISRMAIEADRSVATPDESREILGLMN